MDIGAWAEMDGVKIWNQLWLIWSYRQKKKKNRVSRGLNSIVALLVIPLAARWGVGWKSEFTPKRQP